MEELLFKAGITRFKPKWGIATGSGSGSAGVIVSSIDNKIIGY